VLSHLSQTLDGIRAMDGLHEVLTETQKKRLKYAGLELATSVTKYLLKAIQCLEDMNVGMFRLGSSFDLSSSEIREEVTANDDR